MTDEALFAELAQLTHVTPERWAQIRALPWNLRRDVLVNYADQDWSQPGTSTWDRVLQILNVLGIIGAAAGAVVAVAGLRSL